MIGFDGLPHGALFCPALTTVSQPMREMGRVACCRLFEAIENPGRIETTEFPMALHRAREHRPGAGAGAVPPLHLVTPSPAPPGMTRARASLASALAGALPRSSASGRSTSRTSGGISRTDARTWPGMSSAPICSASRYPDYRQRTRPGCSTPPPTWPGRARRDRHPGSCRRAASRDAADPVRSLPDAARRRGPPRRCWSRRCS